jgi:hypothetical protein
MLTLAFVIQSVRATESASDALNDTLEIIPRTTETIVNETFGIRVQFSEGSEHWLKFNGSFRLGWNETLLGYTGLSVWWGSPQITVRSGYIYVRYDSPPSHDAMLVWLTFQALCTGVADLHLYNTNIPTKDGQVIIGEISAPNGEVKFRGVAASDEEWCDNSGYCCNVTVEEILSDLNNTLSIGDVVTVCYNSSLSIKVGDYVECFGYYWKNCGPMQFIGKIECINDGYYVVPEFSVLVLPLFMIATLLAVVFFIKKHSADQKRYAPAF